MMCWLTFQHSVVRYPDQVSIFTGFNKPGVAWREVRFQRLAQFLVQVGAFDQQAHFGVDAQGTRIQVGTTNESLVVIKQHNLGVKAQGFVFHGRFDIEVPVFRIVPDLVDFDAHLHQRLDVLAIHTYAPTGDYSN